MKLKMFPGTVFKGVGRLLLNVDPMYSTLKMRRLPQEVIIIHLDQK